MRVIYHLYALIPSRACPLSPFLPPTPPPIHLPPIMHPILYVVVVVLSLLLFCYCSLQSSNLTALLFACAVGHTDVALALIATPSLNVNHADVSIIITPSHVVGGNGDGQIPLLPTHLLPCMSHDP